MNEILNAAMAYIGAEESRRDLEFIASSYMIKHAHELEDALVKSNLTTMYRQQADEKVVVELEYRKLVKLIEEFNMQSN